MGKSLVGDRDRKRGQAQGHSSCLACCRPVDVVGSSTKGRCGILRALGVVMPGILDNEMEWHVTVSFVEGYDDWADRRG